MEDLVFLMKLNRHVIIEISSGRSIYGGLSIFKYKTLSTHTSQQFQLWLRWFEHSQNRGIEPNFRCTLVQNYFEIIKEGLQGVPILDKLKDFEIEISEHLELELQKEHNKLPYILMIPLMLFIFPAFLVLILGPILKTVAGSL